MKKRRKRVPTAVVRKGSVEVKIFSESYQSGGRPYTRFIVEYYEGPGLRRRVKRSDLAEAKKEADTIANRLSRGQHHILQLSGTDRDAYLAAKRLLLPTGVSLVEAAKQFASAHKVLPAGATLWEASDLLAKQRQQIRNPMTVQQVVDLLVAEKEKAEKSKSYVQQLRNSCGKFAQAFQMEIHRLTTEMLIRYFDNLNGAPRTRLNHLMYVTSLFKFAVARKSAPEELLKDLGAIQRPSVTESEKEIYTPAEMREMLVAVRRELLPQLVLCAYAGLRKAESVRVDWVQIKLDRGFVELKGRQSKVGQRRLAPLTGFAADWLRLVAREKGPIAHYQHADKFNAAVSEDVNRVRLKQNLKPDFRWKNNGLRDSFISYRVAAIKNVPQVALEAGNSPVMIQRHYLEVVSEEEAEDYFSIAPPVAHR
jgi:integrase